MNRVPIEFDLARIAEFCRRRGVRELSIFGSTASGAAKPTSDVDVLVELAPGHYPDVDEWDAMTAELTALLEGRVDLISKRGIQNPFVRHEILTNRKILYAA